MELWRSVFLLLSTFLLSVSAAPRAIALDSRAITCQNDPVVKILQLLRASSFCSSFLHITTSTVLQTAVSSTTSVTETTSTSVLQILLLASTSTTSTVVESTTIGLPGSTVTSTASTVIVTPPPVTTTLNTGTTITSTITTTSVAGGLMRKLRRGIESLEARAVEEIQERAVQIPSQLVAFASSVISQACNCYVTSRPTTTSTVHTTTTIVSTDVVPTISTTSLVTGTTTSVSLTTVTSTLTTTSPEVIVLTTVTTNLLPATVTSTIVSTSTAVTTVAVNLQGVSVSPFFGPTTGCFVTILNTFTAEQLFNEFIGLGFTANGAFQHCAAQCASIAPRGTCKFFQVLFVQTSSFSSWFCTAQSTIPDQTQMASSHSWLLCGIDPGVKQGAGYLVNYS